ncbi:hypothetical protein [Sulfuriferula sp.]|uniref:DUF6932 family protein n=1 Tax=Sulfuriferula sp. TaxID=2025307 RepID=UPI0027309ECB|nr:hypothetical protein [Sulfuriferula sp.]MDP2025516.1 hypothetical protein [Sulfuriferula sp.]
MIFVPIPQWNAQGLIPPVDVASPTSANRSPYVVTLNDLVMRFGVSAERCRILDGLLRYRAALHGLGVTQGFQWLDGSFLEHIEILDSRPPNDIDVVTFFHLPTGETQASLASGAPPVFDSQTSKKNYYVDAYLVCLGGRSEKLVAHSAYWYSVWSHRRNQMWKGYVQIDLSPSEDATATSLLDTLQTTGGLP